MCRVGFAAVHRTALFGRAIQQFQELVEGDGDLTSTLVNNLLGAAS